MNTPSALDFVTGAVAVCTLAVGGSSLWDRYAPVSQSPTLESPTPIDDWNEVVAGGLRMGPRDARVIVVEFGDYECPFCRRAAPTLAALMDEFPNDLAVVYRHLPLAQHANAYFAARLAECSARQDRFETAHDLLNRVLTFEQLDLRRFAEQVAIPSLAPFLKCAQEMGPMARIEADIALADHLNVSRTPTYAIDGMLVGSLSPERLDAMLRQAITW